MIAFSNMRGLSVIAVLMLLLIPGCTTPPSAEEEVTEEEFTVPERLNLVADTAGREIDRGDKMNLLEDAAGKNTLILWVSTGCSG